MGDTAIANARPRHTRRLLGLAALFTLVDAAATALWLQLGMALWGLLGRSPTARHGLPVVTGVLGGVCIWHGAGAVLIVAQVVA